MYNNKKLLIIDTKYIIIKGFLVNIHMMRISSLLAISILVATSLAFASINLNNIYGQQTPQSPAVNQQQQAAQQQALAQQQAATAQSSQRNQTSAQSSQGNQTSAQSSQGNQTSAQSSQGNQTSAQGN